MNKLLFLLLCWFPTLLFSQVYPHNKPEKPLQTLSIAEVNAVFDDANKIYKSRDLNKLIDQVSAVLNGAVLIAQDDIIITQRSAGYNKMNVKRSDKRNTDTTCFELASVSKQFTATCILQLIAREKLFLEDQLTDFFPNLPYPNITIRHLLTHTSGLPEFFHFDPKWYQYNGLLKNRDVIKALEVHRPKTVFKPGDRFSYTNTNYMLLAAIVEKVSGQSFEEYLKKNIFIPAGMRHSFCVTQLSQKRQEESIASGHKKKDVPLAIEFDDGTMGEKGIYSTVKDLFAWKKAYFNEGRILPKEWVFAASHPENQLNDGNYPSELYGYGFRLEENPSFGRLVYHGGLWHGFQHLYLYYPEKNVFMVFLSNYCNGAHRGKSSEILKILCGV